MSRVLEIKKLRKSFRDRIVLKDIDMDLNRKENLAILGESGSGKSVLAKCIVGLIKPDRGTIRIFGEDITNMSTDEIDKIRKRIGYLFQGGALYDSMSVRQNLEFPVRRTQLSKNRKEVNEMVEEALLNVGLIDAIDKMPSELSGGMKKRIGLARTLILKPEIILYDEPTTGLDPRSAGQISELIMEVHAQYQASSIIITHDLKCARLTGHKIKLLKDGVFYAEGSYEDLANSDDSKVNEYFN